MRNTEAFEWPLHLIGQSKELYFLVKIKSDNVLRDPIFRNMGQFSRLRLETVPYS